MPDDLHDEWFRIIAMFLQIGDITINRAARPIGVEDQPELIAFANGSLLAYACAVYVRWKLLKTSESEPDQFMVRLLCAKARVTSIRGTTAPRSEVSGFLILSRLLKVVMNSMDIKPSQVTVAVDSQCTISAIEKSGGVLAPYFASHISESMANLSEVAE